MAESSVRRSCASAAFSGEGAPVAHGPADAARGGEPRGGEPGGEATAGDDRSPPPIDGGRRCGGGAATAAGGALCAAVERLGDGGPW